MLYWRKPVSPFQLQNFTYYKNIVHRFEANEVLFMPIKIPDNLPAAKILDAENVFIMSEQRAVHQDIRPLKIVILNLMPTKEETETQLLRLLGNSPLQVDVTLLQAATHISKNTSAKYLEEFYHTFDEIQDEKYDGMIITGAPVEALRFEDVDYWEELRMIMDWTLSHVYSTLHICWGAQAGLYYHHHIPKYPLPEKLSGIFRHRVLEPTHPLMRGFDEIFYMPHSRYTEVRQEDIEKVPGLSVLALSETAGAAIVSTSDGRQLFVTGIPWPTNTAGICRRESILRFRSIISRTIIRKPSLPLSGVGMHTC